MPRTPSPEVRTRLVERAAELLARREPVTVRALAQSAGVSTMAVYTHFGGLPGLWEAVRREGFSRLSARLRRVRLTDDPVQDLCALGAAYVDHALADPHLYRTMFDEAVALTDPAEAAAGLVGLVGCATRAVTAGRFRDSCDPEALAVRYWAAGHGLSMLVVAGVLPRDAVPVHGPALAYALFLAAGDDADRCRRSVAAGWRPAGP